jgi:HlyD family secretion protein
MTAKKGILIGAAIIVVAAAGAAAWLWYGPRESNTSLTLYGNVDIREVELAFRVPGRLEKMYVDEGESVTAGQLVAELDAEPYRESVDVAAARVQQAEANVAKMKAGSRPQEVERARAAVAEARAMYEDADSDYQRQNGLFESGASSEKARNAARARRDEAAAKLSSAREALALAEEGFRAEDIAAAEADFAAAKAQHELAKTQLEDTKLFAPSAGILLSRVREPGSMLGQGAPVYSLSLRDPIYVRAYVSEPNLGKLTPGSKVTVTTDSSDKIYHGHVGFISPRAEFTPKSVQTTDLRTDLVYRLRIVVDDADDGLRQGMPVTAQVPLAPEAQ